MISVDCRSARSVAATGFPSARVRSVVAATAWWLALQLTTASWCAALQPENVLLVVNARSWSSWTIANHYMRLRDIPASNVVSLDWPGSVVEVSVDDFRDWILKPILRQIQSRGLGRQIRCIVYSADFPYAVSFAADSAEGQAGKGGGNLNVGSITGLTFHHDLVLNRATNYTGLAANRYAQTGLARRHASRFGAPIAGPTHAPHYLSIMLGYTSGRGNSVDEVVRSLTRSRFADGVFPAGSFYFMTNQDVRTKTRSQRFPAVRRALQREHRQVEIVEDIMFPRNRRDILGLMMGYSRIKWRNSKSSLLPGTICENLTSFGGILDEQGRQTPISEFISWGAAGTTGTVVEPYAIAAKFPDPVMHLHYTRGLTLVESIYASVLNPYQLLVMGDPLCQPWLNQQPIEIVELKRDQQQATELLTLRPSVSGDVQLSEPYFELFVDGRQLGRCEPDQAFVVNTAQFPAGYHEAVVILQDDADLRICGRRRFPFVVESGPATLSAELVGDTTVAYGNPTAIALEPKGIARVVAFHARQPVGQQTITADKRSHLVTIETRRLGLGPAELTVVGVTRDGQSVTCQPLRLNVIPAQPLPAQLAPVGEPVAQITVSRAAAPSPEAVESTVKSAWLQRAGVQDNEPFTVAARVQAETTGMHQVQAVFKGNLTLSIDNQRMMVESHPGYLRTEVPMCLEKGVHELWVSGRLDDVSLFVLRFGHQGAPRIGKNRIIR